MQIHLDALRPRLAVSPADRAGLVGGDPSACSAGCRRRWRQPPLGCSADDAEERHHRSGGVHDLHSRHGRLRGGTGVRREIHEFVRRIIMLVLVVSFIVGVTNLASALGIAGAVV